jgi:glutaredoxin
VRITPRIGVALGAGGLLALIALGVGIRRLSSADVLVHAESPPAVAEAESEEVSDEPSEPPRAIDTSSAELRLAAAETPRPEASTRPAAADAAAQASDAASARVPTPEQIQTALRETPVVMYTTKWCASCAKARAFFRANGVPFEERDVEASERNRADLLRLSGASSVPLIDVDGKKLTGFGEQSVTEALRDSVERRLGVNGLKIERR